MNVCHANWLHSAYINLQTYIRMSNSDLPVVKTLLASVGVQVQ